jgi:hypothetical protein
MLPADRRSAPIGPEVSWPAGYSDQGYRDGDYRYEAPQAEQLPPASHGGHPYAAFTTAGYGDDGYRDPGYQGPAAQDAGIAGTRTVRGFVETGQGWGQADYAVPDGYAQSSYQQGNGAGYAQGPGYGQSGYAGSSYAPAGQIEMAYPSSAQSTEEYHGADSHRQPWDYDQPLRYDDGEVAYQGQDEYPANGEYQSVNYLSGAYPIADYDGGRPSPGYDPDAYNGSDYSTPGIGGSGYDLAGIIGTSDFEAVGYDEPSYDRLAYDDPRYGQGHGYANSRSPFDETRFDAPGFDETRLDNLWLPGEDVRQEAAPVGYGNDGFTDGPVRSGYSDFDPGQRGGRFAETRFDMSAVDLNVDHTRFDVPAFDETRVDSLRRTSTDLLAIPGNRTGGAALLTRPSAQPRSWVEDTSFDHFADLDLTDEPVPAAFTRTIERPETEDDTATRRAVGRRRGRSGDRRQWMALGAIAVVAAGAIGGVLMKYVFAGPSGPAHEIVAPASVDGYTSSASLGEQTHVTALAQAFAKSSGGSASDVVSAVYQQGAGGATTPGIDSQMFMFVGGKLANANATAELANFTQSYKGTRDVSAGSLKGEAACTETHVNGENAAMCVWFDNDTFGAVVSPTMTSAQLASTMDNVRPTLETLAN